MSGLSDSRPLLMSVQLSTQQKSHHTKSRTMRRNKQKERLCINHSLSMCWCCPFYSLSQQTVCAQLDTKKMVYICFAFLTVLILVARIPLILINHTIVCPLSHRIPKQQVLKQNLEELNNLQSSNSKAT